MYKPPTCSPLSSDSGGKPYISYVCAKITAELGSLSQETSNISYFVRANNWHDLPGSSDSRCLTRMPSSEGSTRGDNCQMLLDWMLAAFWWTIDLRASVPGWLLARGLCPFLVMGFSHKKVTKWQLASSEQEREKDRFTRGNQSS